MAFIVHVNLRHNLSRTLKIVNKLVDVKILTEQQVRHLPRWAHRRPIRIVNENDSRPENSSYVEKLNIERGSILQLPINEESQFQVQDKELTKQNQFPMKPEKQTHFTGECYEADWYKNYQLESENTNKPLKKGDARNKSDLKPKTKKERKHEKKKEMKLNRLIDSATKAGVPMYTKLAADDPKLSRFMLIAKSKNKKLKRSHIVLEGKRLIKDAIDAGYVPEQVFFSRVSDVANLGLPDDGIELYKVTYKHIELWSDLSTPPGILGFLKTPDIDKKKPGKDAMPLTIICDNIRDPGNLGTILRGAAGVGCHKVILTKGCVDLWEPKVLRSGAGAHFRTPIVSDVEWEDLESHVDNDASIFLADSNVLSQSSEQDHASESGDSSTESYENCLNSIPMITYFAADYPNCGAIVIVIGGETEGLSVGALKLANERAGVRLNIPLSNNVDSLNSGIALSIVTFEMKRQFLSKMSNKDGAEEIELKASGV